MKDKLDCEKATAELDGQFMGEVSTEAFPKGCYFFKVEGSRHQMYWNSHSEGSINSSAGPLCMSALGKVCI